MIAPEIRRGKVSDASALAELAARTFYAVHAPLTSAKECRDYVDAAFTKEGQAAELADPKSAFFTAWVGQVMAGYAKLAEKAPPLPVGDRPVALQRIYLDDQWLGSGIGARLMEACIEEAVSRGFQTLWLQVHDKNDRAIEFYKKRGFSIVAPCTFAMGARINCNYLMAAPLI
jgi:ribosomal protein S18 acetylase RimI-like enzyme